MLLVAFGTANCSTDSNRLLDSPLQNPYAGGRPSDTTGSVAAQAAPAGRVVSAPLAGAAVSQQPLPPPPAARGAILPTIARPSTTDVTGGVPKLQAARPGASQQWDWEGGTPITVAPGDTLASLSKRYGVPAAAIADSNGLTTTASLQTGRRLVIPRYKGPGEQRAAGPGPRTAGATHIVGPGDTLAGIAKRYSVQITDIASTNNIVPHAVLKIGDRLTIPSKARTASTPIAEQVSGPKVAAPATVPVQKRAEAPPAPPAAKPVKEANADVPNIAVIKPTDPSTVQDERPAAGPSGLAFRWPVKGRVINGFGKINGQQNDGINLAVPEGTAVKAAEDGIVAYAGSELKGYGQLVLIRHANGFVTAYAHNSELMVKRNDQVRRGQVIAKSGQSGTVNSPQLHFEIRKGASPVDPMEHLPSGV